MTISDSRFSDALPAEVRAALYADYPTYRAIITMLDRLSEVLDLSMKARLSRTAEHSKLQPVLDFMIDEGRLFLFRINCPDRIFLRFTTRTDLHRFLEAAKPERAVSGSSLSSNPKGWPSYFEMMTAFYARDVDYDRVSTALSNVLRRSPTRRSVKQSGDSELEALLREIHKPQDEGIFDQIFENILDHINEGNFAAIMTSLPAYDPHAEDDPGSVPGMQLILMNDLVRERGRCIERSRELLPSVRNELQKVGKQSQADLAELDALQAYIDALLS